MKPYAQALGVVSRPPETIAPQGGKKPYISIPLTCHDPRSQYPAYITACLYPRDNETPEKFMVGSTLFVAGPIQTSVYTSKKDNQPKASLKIIVREYQVVVDAGNPVQQQQPPAPAPEPEPAPARKPKPTTKPAPAVSDPEDDVPF